jgi:hypothetical protein
MRVSDADTYVPLFAKMSEFTWQILWLLTSSELNAVDLYKDTVFLILTYLRDMFFSNYLGDMWNDLAWCYCTQKNLYLFVNFAFWKLSSFTVEMELAHVHYMNENIEHLN